MIPTIALHQRSYGALLDPDRHAYAQLVLPVAGEVRLEIEGKAGRLDLVHGALVAPGAWHAQCSSVSNRSLILDVGLDAITYGVWQRLLERRFMTLSPAARKLIEYLGMMAEQQATPSVVLQGWLPLLLDTLALVAPQPVSRLAALLARIQGAPGLPWTTETMARCAGVSVSRLHVLFREELDATPHAWLQQQRIEAACTWLAGSGRKVAEIALAAGFADQSALTRAMRQALDTTPAAYRKRMLENLTRCAASLVVHGEVKSADGAAVRRQLNRVCAYFCTGYNYSMLRLQAFKFELMPDGAQKRAMRRFAGACRFVFNKAVAMQKENHEAGMKFIGFAGLCRALTGWRHDAETPWLQDAPCHPLQQALKDLEKAYKNFFEKRAGFPGFKRKGNGDSFRYPDPKQIKLDEANGRLFLPKLGWLRYRNSRKVLGQVRNVTVSQSGGKWFASIQTQREVEQPLPTATKDIGIDVGIVRFATMSDGDFIAPLNSFKKHQQRLARYQRRLRRKVKFSSNWRKAQARVQKIHARIANARKDFLHKATTTISNNHALVCIEDVQVRNMSRSAKGTIEQPGRNVRQKSGLNRAILDQGWGEFRRQLGYKLAWRGGMLLAVPPHHTSQTCPACGHVSQDNRRTQAQFLCVGCAYENHADVVGAINILARGHRVIACGEPARSGRSMKQEPTVKRLHKLPCSAEGIPFVHGGEEVKKTQ